MQPVSGTEDTGDEGSLSLRKCTSAECVPLQHCEGSSS